jgi:hypothetical protein
MDLDSFLVSLYVLVEDWWQERHPSSARKKKPGRPVLLTDPEVITLAILAQWPRFRSERDFWRFASAHLRAYFPNLCTQGQFNRRVRALELELRALQRTLAGRIAEPSAVYRVLDTTLVPAVVRVRASRKGLFCGQASFGRSASKTEWAYGFTGVEWERRWLEVYGSLVAATPYEDSSRAWPKKDLRWASGKRQIIEGVICQLKDFFSLERHQAKTLAGLLARLAAKIAAYTCAQRMNDSLGRPLRHLADLLI